ncbi:MAG TPA: hypothetical protein VEI54_05955 [Candidatus Limnocylindrales bacterium]|nr:hypothetical protein [Candidatus Limnocylindrales bacterium]
MWPVDEQWGEVRVAYVIVKGSACTNEHGLIEFLGSSISKIKAPRQIVFIEALSPNSKGKVPKLDLRGLLRNRKLETRPGPFGFAGYDIIVGGAL